MDQQREHILVTESVSTFLDASREQELEALGAHQALMAMLHRLNAAFNSIPDIPIAGPALPPLLLSQAHSAFLAAVRLSLGGQVHVAYMALRGCIESALYAVILKLQPHRQEVWVNRITNRSLCQRTFTARAGLSLLVEIDPPLTQLITEVYETCIDRGAHPNVLSLGSHLDFEGWDAENKISNILLLPPDSAPVEAALHCCVLVGSAVASLCIYVMPDHTPAAVSYDEAAEVMDLYRKFVILD